MNFLISNMEEYIRGISPVERLVSFVTTQLFPNEKVAAANCTIDGCQCHYNPTTNKSTGFYYWQVNKDTFICNTNCPFTFTGNAC